MKLKSNPKSVDLTTRVLKSLPRGFVFTAKVTTSSMNPALRLGSLIRVKRVSIREVNRGDIVMFGMPGQRLPVVHRVLDKINRNSVTCLKTKGDAAAAVDPGLVSPRNFLGKVIGRTHRSTGIVAKLKQFLNLG
ncbi:MAG: signal peptidase I [Patescibacteria group bacterium]